MRFVTARADQILCVIGNLNDPDPKLPEQSDVPDLVLKSRDILKTKQDPRLAFVLGAADIGGRVDLKDEIVILSEKLFPVGDVVHRALKVFPYGTRTVRGGHSATAHLEENAAIPLRNNQAIENYQAVVERRSLSRSK